MVSMRFHDDIYHTRESQQRVDANLMNLTGAELGDSIA